MRGYEIMRNHAGHFQGKNAKMIFMEDDNESRKGEKGPGGHRKSAPILRRERGSR